MDEADKLKVSISVNYDFVFKCEKVICAIYEVGQALKIGSLWIEDNRDSLEVGGNQTGTSCRQLKRPNKNKIIAPRSKATKKDAITSVKDQSVDDVLKYLNILPELPDDLQCISCPYKATRKTHLKTHYQLKHLGGVGISAICTLCQEKRSTRSNLKRHMISAHNLTGEQASKLMS